MPTPKQVTVFELSKLSAPGLRLYELESGTAPGYAALREMVETLEWCRTEDWNRAQALRVLDEEEWESLYPDGPLYLGKR